MYVNKSWWMKSAVNFGFTEQLRCYLKGHFDMLHKSIKDFMIPMTVSHFDNFLQTYTSNTRMAFLEMCLPLGILLCTFIRLIAIKTTNTRMAFLEMCRP